MIGQTEQSTSAEDKPQQWERSEKHDDLPRRLALSLGAFAVLSGRSISARRPEVLRSVAGVTVAFCVCLCSTHVRVTGSLDAALQSVDLDNQRIQLIDEMTIAFLGTLFAALPIRRPIAPLLGASIYTILSYVIPFVRHAEQASTAITGGGVAQAILPGALEHTTLILTALCVLAAVFGAAIGATLGTITLGPILDLYRAIWANLRHAGPRPSLAVRLRAVGGLAATLILVGLLSLASDSGPLWAFGIDSNLFSVQQPTPQPGGQSLHGTVVMGRYFSKALDESLPYEVYLPPSYSVATAKRYPTCYLLHGSPGTFTDWLGPNGGAASFVEEALLAGNKMRETILAASDGNGTVYKEAHWANAYTGRQRMEDAIAYDFVHFIDTTYRTLADVADRTIAGNSDGGFGAFNLAFHHPDIFSGVASPGGYFEAPTNEPGVFGVGPKAVPNQLYYSPSEYVRTPSGKEAAQSLRMIIVVGAQDGALYTDGVAFYKTLQSEHLAAQLVVLPGGHQWSVWRGGAAEAFEVFDPPDAAVPSPTPTISGK